MLYIIDSSNKTKFEALMSALGQSPEEKISIKRIIANGAPDVRPLTLADAKNAANEGVDALVRSFLAQDDRTEETAIALCLQKGAAVLDRDHPELVCVVAMRKTNNPAISFAYCTPIPLDQQIKTLVEDGMEIYAAYGTVYGPEVAEKTISLHQVLAVSQTEVEWMSDGIMQILKQ
jgi:hypothetical protein